jgi:hypothetical protein
MSDWNLQRAFESSFLHSDAPMPRPPDPPDFGIVSETAVPSLRNLSAVLGARNPNSRTRPAS